MYRWVWQLEAPLHIGMPPAGMLNRTRLYAPARALWGALTAELARRQSPPDYQAVGNQLRKQTRLSYLFPAQRVGEKWLAWLPEYERGKGLQWRREDRTGSVPDAQFRRWLLTTQPGTAIDSNSDTAAEGTLREHEVINYFSRWGEERNPQPVALAGYVFLANGADPSVLDIEELFVGGDIRYGLGRIRKVECSEADRFFGKQVDLKGSDPVVQTDSVLAHALPDPGADPYGAWEQLAMWDHGELKTAQLVWMPGSRAKDNSSLWRIREDGLWERTQEDNPWSAA
jgi:hypothetical protein